MAKEDAGSTKTLTRPPCPFCGGHRVIGNGYHVSKMDNKTLYKRWKCKDCKKTFSRRFWKPKNKKNENPFFCFCEKYHQPLFRIKQTPFFHEFLTPDGKTHLCIKLRNGVQRRCMKLSEYHFLSSPKEKI